MTLLDQRPARMRLVVREWEVLRADEESAVLMPWERDEPPQPPGLVDFQPKRTRTVFADELIMH